MQRGRAEFAMPSMEGLDQGNRQAHWEYLLEFPCDRVKQRSTDKSRHRMFAATLLRNLRARCLAPGNWRHLPNYKQKLCVYMAVSPEMQHINYF